MRKTIAAIAVASIAALSAGCADTPRKAADEPAVASTDTTSHQITDEVDSAPSANEPAPVDESGDEINRPEKTVAIGQTAVDDRVTFKVHSIEVVGSIATNGYLAKGPITPTHGAKLIKVTLTWKNNTGQPRDLFCGGGPATLIDRHTNNYKPMDNILELNGGDGGPCGSDVNPGFTQNITLAFQMPRTAMTRGVALWNDAAEDDFSGDTFVLFEK